ncbi:hypothetical protein [Polycladidibacter stylochi]|uniref:hypothetical protein n=1 Tax=Polycladidibacter stylochi TaxID=1807766 RepID=UPI0008299ECA|nr:hypothetical protein [Pseudovibrio stylochi]
MAKFLKISDDIELNNPIEFWGSFFNDEGHSKQTNSIKDYEELLERLAHQSKHITLIGRGEIKHSNIYNTIFNKIVLICENNKLPYFNKNKLLTIKYTNYFSLLGFAALTCVISKFEPDFSLSVLGKDQEFDIAYMQYYVFINSNLNKSYLSVEIKKQADILKKDIQEKEKANTEDFELLAKQKTQEAIGNIKESAQAKLNEFAESFKLNSARSNWTKKYNGHKCSLICSGIFCLFLFTIPIFATIILHKEIIDYVAQVSISFASALPKETTNSLGVEIIRQFGKLLFISIPIVIYFWLCRLTVRFCLRSLMLMDDANQRRVILDTYLQLIGDNVSQTEDRELLLRALFAPLPGHSDAKIDLPIPQQIRN